MCSNESLMYSNLFGTTRSNHSNPFFCVQLRFKEEKGDAGRRGAALGLGLLQFLSLFRFNAGDPTNPLVDKIGSCQADFAHMTAMKRRWRPGIDRLGEEGRCGSRPSTIMRMRGYIGSS